jgi:hypothetical protein
MAVETVAKRGRGRPRNPFPCTSRSLNFPDKLYARLRTEAKRRSMLISQTMIALLHEALLVHERRP